MKFVKENGRNTLLAKQSIIRNGYSKEHLSEVSCGLGRMNIDGLFWMPGYKGLVSADLKRLDSFL